MNDKVIDKAFERLDKAVDALGNGVKHGYEVYVTQQVVDGTIKAILLGLCLILICTAVCLTLRNLIKKGYYEKPDGDRLLGTGLVLVMPLIVILLMGSAFAESVTQIYNPEYYAIREILNTVNK